MEGRTFLSERVIEDGAMRELVVGTRLLLRFHEATGDTSDMDDMPETWVGAYTGCNWWSGLYTIDGDTLVVTRGDHTFDRPNRRP